MFSLLIFLFLFTLKLLGKLSKHLITHVGYCSFQEADSDPTGEAAANTQQTLTFYELDLGLNHVVRKYSEALEEHGNFLITGKY